MAHFNTKDARRIARGTRRLEVTPLNTIPAAAGPRFGDGSGNNRWFWTTGSISVATATGTTVSTAVLTAGSGTARICVDGTGGIKPDVSSGAADLTIYNGLNGSAIPSGTFVFCNLSSGKWTITIAWC